MGTDHGHGPIRERRGVRYTEVRLGWLWKHEPGTYVKFAPDAKARGVYRGRKASIDPAKVKALKAEGMGPSAIAKTLKIGRASVYRVLGERR